MANEQDKAAEDMVTVAGGVTLQVTYQVNGRGEEPKKELVKIRQIPISKLSEFLLTLGDEAHSIELYCDKPKGWADTLSLESANEVADEGQRINRPFLNAWWRRQAKWRDMQEAWTGGRDAGKKLAPETTSASVSSAPQSPTTTT